MSRSASLSFAARSLGQPLAFTLSIKKAFDGSEKKFQINFVATHYFQ